MNLEDPPRSGPQPGSRLDRPCCPACGKRDQMVPGPETTGDRVFPAYTCLRCAKPWNRNGEECLEYEPAERTKEHAETIRTMLDGDEVDP